MKEVRCTVEELGELCRQRKAVCFGAGDWLMDSFFGERYKRFEFEKSVSAVIDNSPEKQNTYIKVRGREIRICSLGQLKKETVPPCFFVITSRRYAGEIVNQLEHELSGCKAEYCIWPSVLNYYHEDIRLPGIIAENGKQAPRIPKRLHWCWVGGGKLPETERLCLESWKKFCPDFEIILWNESNFDIKSNAYVYEAYENKKYAFVSDYIRLWCIWHYGGIYLDTDVELFKPLDPFLGHRAFSGFQEREYIPTGIIGGEKGSKWIGYLMSYYNDRHFVTEKGFDLTTNVAAITEMTEQKFHICLENKYIDLEEVTLYPQEVFCPLDWDTGYRNITRNTYCIHKFSGSWG